MDLYGPRVEAASTRISTGWPQTATAATSPNRTMDFMLISRIQYQGTRKPTLEETVKLEGVYSVLPTPFTAAGDLDLESLKRVIDLFIGAGVNGLTALGVTSEIVRVLETVVRHVDGRVRVVAGASADGLGTCNGYTKLARETGADAVMISPPRAPKLNSDGVVRHFAAVADAVEIPIVIQDYPPVSGFAMEPWLLVRIAREVAAANTIKLEDPPTPFKTSRIREAAQGMDLGIFGGLGGVFLLEELMAGATGAMTGFAYPEVLVKVVGRFRAGDLDGAAEARSEERRVGEE